MHPLTHCCLRSEGHCQAQVSFATGGANRPHASTPHRTTLTLGTRFYRYVRGGPAEVVPERSQARTVSVQEEEHEAILT